MIIDDDISIDTCFAAKNTKGVAGRKVAALHTYKGIKTIPPHCSSSGLVIAIQGNLQGGRNRNRRNGEEGGGGGKEDEVEEMGSQSPLCALGEFH